MAYFGRANLYLEKKDYEKAIQDYDKAIKLDSKLVWAYECRGYYYYIKKEYGKAKADLDESLKLDAKSPIQYDIRGLIELRLNNFDDALRNFEIASKFDERLECTFFYFSLYYWYAKKDAKKSLEYLETAFQKDFDDFEALYDEEKEGFFLKGLNQTKEFKEIVQKYKKNN